MELDWRTLDELRATYLDGSAGPVDYWKTDSLLHGYDATFARRIAWKWHWVFADLERRGWSPPSGTLEGLHRLNGGDEPPVSGVGQSHLRFARVEYGLPGLRIVMRHRHAHAAVLDRNIEFVELAA